MCSGRDSNVRFLRVDQFIFMDIQHIKQPALIQPAGELIAMPIEAVSPNPIPLNPHIVQFIDHAQRLLRLALMTPGLSWNPRGGTPVRILRPGFGQEEPFIDQACGGVVA